MRKIALLLVFVMVFSALASCGAAAEPEKEAEFIPVDTEHLTTIFWNPVLVECEKQIDTPEYRAAIAKIYNGLAGIEPYKGNVATLWKLTMIVFDGEHQSTYTVAGIVEDDNRFNVTVTGAAAGGADKVQYSVVSEELKNFINDEILTVKTEEIKCEVEFVLAKGTPDPDGNAREADEPLGSEKVTLTVKETEHVTAAKAASEALGKGNISSDYRLSAGSDRVIAINGNEEKVTQIEGGVERAYWKYSVNGSKTDASADALNDGDVVTVVYTLERVTSN